MEGAEGATCGALAVRGSARAARESSEGGPLILLGFQESIGMGCRSVTSIPRMTDGK